MNRDTVISRNILISNFFASRVDRMRSSEIRELLKLISADVISFTGGAPDPITFPEKDDLMDAFNYILENRGVAFQYGVTDGLPELRGSIIKFMERRMNIKAGLENVIVTVGSQEALEITGRLFINKGDKVALGLPTYIAAIQAYNLYRPRYVGIPVDFDGLNVDILESEVKKHYRTRRPIKLVYVIPTGQNPTGTIMSLDRRKHILELASKYDFFIVEDDPYGFISFTRDIPPRIKALDNENRVIYLSTFSKIFAPGARIGWIVAEQTIAKYVSLAIQAINLCPSNFNQFMIKYFLDKGLIDKYIDRNRRIYKEKRDAMLEALEDRMPGNIEWTRPNAGFFVFMYLPEHMDGKKLLYNAIRDEKVAFVPGSGFYVDGSGHNTIRLSYSLPPPHLIREGIVRLSRIIKKYVT